MQNWQQTLYAQFANSPSICTLLDGFNQAIDPAQSVADWYSQVWNVQTAVGYGLDVWGRIVGVSRVLQVAASDFLGFDEASDSSDAIEPFNQGVFYNGSPTTANYALSDDAYRLLILAKAAANITDGSITSLNAILMGLFSASGDIWVVDNNNMTMAIDFDFDLSPVQSAIIEQSGVIPVPAGVSISYRKVDSIPRPSTVGSFEADFNTLS